MRRELVLCLFPAFPFCYHAELYPHLPLCSVERMLLQYVSGVSTITSAVGPITSHTGTESASASASALAAIAQAATADSMGALTHTLWSPEHMVKSILGRTLHGAGGATCPRAAGADKAAIAAAAAAAAKQKGGVAISDEEADDAAVSFDTSDPMPAVLVQATRLALGISISTR